MAVVQRGGTVRAVVRRAGTAPALDGLSEHVGDFADPSFAAPVVEGADAVVSTVHPMGSDRATQERVAVEGTSLLARASRDAGVAASCTSRPVPCTTAGPERVTWTRRRGWWATTRTTMR